MAAAAPGGAGGACAVAGLRTGGALQGTRVRWESAAGSPSAQKAPPTRQTSKTPVYPPGQRHPAGLLLAEKGPVYQPGQQGPVYPPGQRHPAGFLLTEKNPVHPPGQRAEARTRGQP